MLETVVSYYASNYEKGEGDPIGVGELADIIRTGKDGLKAQIGEIRDLATQHSRALAANDTVEAKRLKTLISEKKAALPVFTGSGLFDKRNKAGLRCHSGMLVLDLDTQDVDADTLTRVTAAIRAHKSTVISFASPSGGLKALVAIESPYPENHEQHELIFFSTIETWLGEVFPDKKIKFDPGKDVCRLCYLSYDPEIWVNKDVHPFRQVARAKKAVFEDVEDTEDAEVAATRARELREGLEANIPGYKMTERAGGKWDGPCPRYFALGTCDRKQDGFVIYPDGTYSCRGCITHGGGEESRAAYEEIRLLAFPVEVPTDICRAPADRKSVV